MRRAALVAVLVALTVFVPSAQTATPALPAPAFTLKGALGGFAAAGFRVAVVAAYDECGIYTARLAAVVEAKPTLVRPGRAVCADDETGPDSYTYDVWLGKTVVGAAVVYSPSPHGESYSLWQGPLPTGPLKALGEEWGWFDSSDTYASGCAWVVVAGGGITAATDLPNRYGVEEGVDDEVTCPGDGKTVILLAGAPRARLTIEGDWNLLATDGKRIVLSRLDPEGLPTGEVAYVALDGKRLATPRLDPVVVKAAYRGWLTPEGLILDTKKGIVAPGWTLKGAGDLVVAYGRAFYLRGRAVHVRRIRDGRDRVLMTLPRTLEQRLAAGSFGLAVALETPAKGDEFVTSVYRIGWRTIDAVLPAR